MTVTVSEFQTLGASLLDRVKRLNEEVSITESGVVVARLVPEAAPLPGKPWHKLRGSALIHGDLTLPIMSDCEAAAALDAESRNLTSRHGD